MDWIKLPNYKSAWYTQHCNHLKHYLSRMELVNGYVMQTIQINVIGKSKQFEAGEIQLDISPFCASVEERGLFLSRLHLDQLGLQKVGERDTRNYGTVAVYTGVRLRIATESCKTIEYEIPDGYVYETPEIFCSASMVSVNHSGIPERQGIINRELFYNHGIMSSGGVLYALPQHLFQISEIPNFMSKYPICEIPVARSSQGQLIYADMNKAMRRMHDVKGVDNVHPCFSEDFFTGDEAISRFLRPLPIEFYTITPSCFHCHKNTLSQVSSAKKKAASRNAVSKSGVLPGDLFYCPLCRTRHVQTPHVYCSKRCQRSHWESTHQAFHMNSHSEQQVLFPPANEAIRTSFRSSYHDRSSVETKVAQFIEKDICGNGEEEEEDEGRTVIFNYSYTYEYFIIGFICFYAVCWLVLRVFTNDVHEHDAHDDL